MSGDENGDQDDEEQKDLMLGIVIKATCIVYCLYRKQLANNLALSATMKSKQTMSMN